MGLKEIDWKRVGKWGARTATAFLVASQAGSYAAGHTPEASPPPRTPAPAPGYMVNTQEPTPTPTLITPASIESNSFPAPVHTPEAPKSIEVSPDILLYAGNVEILGSSSAMEIANMLEENPKLCGELLVGAETCEVHNDHSGETFESLRIKAEKGHFQPTKFKDANTIIIITGGNNSIMNITDLNAAATLAVAGGQQHDLGALIRVYGMTEQEKQCAIADKIASEGIDLIKTLEKLNPNAQIIHILPLPTLLDINNANLSHIRDQVSHRLYNFSLYDSRVHSYIGDRLIMDENWQPDPTKFIPGDNKHFTPKTYQGLLNDAFRSSADKFYGWNLLKMIDRKLKKY